MQRIAAAPSGSLLPPLAIGIPNAFRKQAIDVGQRAVATDKEAEALAICLARPFAGPRLAARIVRIESDAAECLPAAMRTTLNVATVLVLAADACAAIGAGLLNHRASPH